MCCKEFKYGLKSLEDGPRSGRPLVATDSETIDYVELELDEDRRLKVREIAAKLELPKSAVLCVITDHLHTPRFLSNDSAQKNKEWHVERRFWAKSWRVFEVKCNWRWEYDGPLPFSKKRVDEVKTTRRGSEYGGQRWPLYFYKRHIFSFSFFPLHYFIYLQLMLFQGLSKPIGSLLVLRLVVQRRRRRVSCVWVTLSSRDGAL